MSDEVETKLTAARTRLILDKPFLGALVLRLPMIEADPGWCQTSATDARSFYYNHDYIDALSLEQTQFVLAHEALHCALSHFSRRQHRIKHRWDVACDLAVNPLLIKDGLKSPPGTLYNESFENMTAEEIYPAIDDLEDEETLDQHLYDEQDQQGGQSNREQDQDSSSGTNNDAEFDESTGGAAQPPPLSDNERESLTVQWQQRLAGAAQQAMQAGKLGESMARLVDHLLQPQLPWRMMLARYMTASARDDYSFQRPSRREGAAILPSLRSTQVELFIVIDTSGSISNEAIHEFVSEVNAIKGQMRARITLHGCDNSLCSSGPWIFEPWEPCEVPESLEGGGGTSFIPPFDWIHNQGREPDLMVYFTDAEGEFPKQEPGFPVIWLVKGKQQVPFGQRIQLN